MARCESCGNEYDKAFQITRGGLSHTFDSFECAIRVMAPECANLPTAAQVLPGATFSTGPATTVGTQNFQCCIHPWMRATVTVVQ